MTKKKEQHKAIQLRRMGLPITIIAKRLGVAKSSVYQWTTEIELSDEKLRQLRISGAKKAWSRRPRSWKGSKYVRLKTKAEKRIGKMTKSKLLYTGLGLYWGEGSKRESGEVEFTNSDPDAIIIWIKFLKEILCVPTSKIRIKAYLFPDINIKDAKSYWLATTQLPESSWFKPYIKRPFNTKKKLSHSKYGTLHVLVYSINLQLEILGKINGIKKWKSIM